jgi:Protein of unknown function (DUF3618)
MASNGRTAEQVQREIEAERDQLAGAVDQLRGEIGHVTDVAGKVKQRLPLVAGAAATLGFVIAGGIGATMRYAARRGRESEEMLHVGRWSVRRR